MIFAFFSCVVCSAEFPRLGESCASNTPMWVGKNQIKIKFWGSLGVCYGKQFVCVKIPLKNTLKMGCFFAYFWGSPELFFLLFWLFLGPEKRVLGPICPNEAIGISIFSRYGPPRPKFLILVLQKIFENPEKCPKTRKNTCIGTPYRPPALPRIVANFPCMGALRAPWTHCDPIGSHSWKIWSLRHIRG